MKAMLEKSTILKETQKSKNKNIITKGESNYIKLIAMSSMFLDHIGAFLLPWNILRFIGRISFPLFAYQLGIGYSKTSNKENYLKRLIYFGILSQIPFLLLRSTSVIYQDKFVLNIFFTLALGIIAIWAIENKKFLLFMPIIPISFLVEYGIYGILVILIFYFFKNNVEQFIGFSFITLIYSYFYLFLSQFFSLFYFIPLILPKIKINLPKYFFYISYPAHLILIYLIKIFF